MAARIYPAILERAEKKTYAVWLPDLPDCVAAGRTQEEAIEKAQDALAVLLETIARPKNFLAFVMLTAAPPDPSERVNVYLPKSLIARADKRAAELGMSRSSFFGYAVSVALTIMTQGGLFTTPRDLKPTPLPTVRKAKGR
jgi:predicted RNase H-like HicB family nuclease